MGTKCSNAVQSNPLRRNCGNVAVNNNRELCGRVGRENNALSLEEIIFFRSGFVPA